VGGDADARPSSADVDVVWRLAGCAACASWRHGVGVAERCSSLSTTAGGEVRIPTLLWIDGEHPGSFGVLRFRGEDNRAVLHGLLGLDDAALDDSNGAGRSPRCRDPVVPGRACKPRSARCRRRLGRAYEIKWDGYRTLVFVDVGEVLRAAAAMTSPPVPRYTPSPTQNAGSAILDGELVALDENGRPSFELFQQRASSRVPCVRRPPDRRPRHHRPRLRAAPRPACRRSTRAATKVPVHRMETAPRCWATPAGHGGVMAKRLGSTYTPASAPPTGAR
jgi:hypothetical protein